jgi:hypothetical protein
MLSDELKTLVDVIGDRETDFFVRASDMLNN